MRILDRYVSLQLIPVWIWCLTVFIFLSCIIDVFEHLDEILRYRITLAEVARYYLNFLPLVVTSASPLALLLSSAFVGMRLSRHQELLAMNASGLNPIRAALPFVFIGLLISFCIFGVNEFVIPKTSVVYEQMRQEVFRGPSPKKLLENVAVLDDQNRLYHARTLNVKLKELRDLTVIEHDWQNRPTKKLRAARAIWTAHGWYLIHGTIYQSGPGGSLSGDPELFIDRLIQYPVTVKSFADPEARPDIMRYGQLKALITKLKQLKLGNVRSYEVELAAKIALPLVNMGICFLGFVGTTQLNKRGQLRGLGTSLGWGMLYYVAVAVAQALAKQLPLSIPFLLGLPHIGAFAWSCYILRRST